MAESQISSPEALLLGELPSECETERFVLQQPFDSLNDYCFSTEVTLPSRPMLNTAVWPDRDTYSRMDSPLS